MDYENLRSEYLELEKILSDDMTCLVFRLTTILVHQSCTFILHSVMLSSLNVNLGMTRGRRKLSQRWCTS